MFGIGNTEIIIILVIIVILFGATKLPKLGASVGQTIRNFRRGMKEVAEEEAAEERKALEAQKLEASEKPSSEEMRSEQENDKNSEKVTT